MYWSHCTDESLLVAIKKVVLDSEPRFMLFTRVQDQFYLEAAGEQLRARAILSVVLGSAVRSAPRVSALLLAAFWKPPPRSVFLSRACVPSSLPGLPLIPVVAQSLTFSPPHKFSPAGQPVGSTCTPLVKSPSAAGSQRSLTGVHGIKQKITRTAGQSHFAHLLPTKTPRR